MKFTKKFKENAALVVLGVVGCIIAFILNVPMSGIEKRLFKKPKKRNMLKLWKR